MTQTIEFTRINNDGDGNPRYVCHFLKLLTEQEKSAEFHQLHGLNAISIMYAIAVKRANKIGGRKYHNKSYGGGIVFGAEPAEIERDIKYILAKDGVENV